MVGESATVIVPFPLNWSQNKKTDDVSVSPAKHMYAKWAKHPAIVKLSRLFDLERNCGFITMMNIRGSSESDSSLQSEPMSSSGIVKNETKPAGQRLIKSSTLPNVAEEVQNTTATEELTMAESDDGSIIITGNATASVEPKNGFKDDQSAKIYQEELDSELNEELIVKPRGFDSRQQKIESLRLELKINDPICASSDSGYDSASGNLSCDSSVEGPTEEEQNKFWYDDWTLLDCQFGLPLFDSGVNETVCEQLVAKKLWEEKRLVLFAVDLPQVEIVLQEIPFMYMHVPKYFCFVVWNSLLNSTQNLENSSWSL